MVSVEHSVEWIKINILLEKYYYKQKCQTSAQARYSQKEIKLSMKANFYKLSPFLSNCFANNRFPTVETCIICHFTPKSHKQQKHITLKDYQYIFVLYHVLMSNSYLVSFLGFDSWLTIEKSENTLAWSLEMALAAVKYMWPKVSYYGFSNYKQTNTH